MEPDTKKNADRERVMSAYTREMNEAIEYREQKEYIWAAYKCGMALGFVRAGFVNGCILLDDYERLMLDGRELFTKILMEGC